MLTGEYSINAKLLYGLLLNRTMLSQKNGWESENGNVYVIYSLDGQKHYLAECAERRGMTVLDTYVEEGKSGKSIEGRTEFQRMLDDIQSGKVHTDYVLVFKLSRFGRNARDVLNSLEFIMKYGVHLMCVEDGLDSSTSMGKMMITILGAVAELERENIIAQSLLGREEKAKSGGWNGGFAPYG